MKPRRTIPSCIFFLEYPALSNLSKFRHVGWTWAGFEARQEGSRAGLLTTRGATASQRNVVPVLNTENAWSLAIISCSWRDRRRDGGQDHTPRATAVSHTRSSISLFSIELSNYFPTGSSHCNLNKFFLFSWTLTLHGVSYEIPSAGLPRVLLSVIFWQQKNSDADKARSAWPLSCLNSATDASVLLLNFLFNIRFSLTLEWSKAGSKKRKRRRCF